MLLDSSSDEGEEKNTLVKREKRSYKRNPLMQGVELHFSSINPCSIFTHLTLNPSTTEARFYVLNAIAFST